MATTTWPAGDTAPPWGFTLQTDSSAGVPLTGLSNTALTLLIKNTSTGIETQGLGSFTIDIFTAPAHVTYAPNNADTAGLNNVNVELRIRVQTSLGPRTLGPYVIQVVPT